MVEPERIVPFLMLALLAVGIWALGLARLDVSRSADEMYSAAGNAGRGMPG